MLYEVITGDGVLLHQLHRLGGHAVLVDGFRVWAHQVARPGGQDVLLFFDGAPQVAIGDDAEKRSGGIDDEGRPQASYNFV